VAKDRADGILRRRLAGLGRAAGASHGHQTITVAWLLLLSLGLGLSGRGAEGQVRGGPLPAVASGSVTLIATLETLAVTAAPVDTGTLVPAAMHSGLQSYAITMRSAIVALRTTVHLQCLVRGTTSAGPEYEVLLPSAMKSGETREPVTRTDFLNIRMDNGTPYLVRSDSPAEQVDIIAQAL